MTTLKNYYYRIRGDGDVLESKDRFVLIRSDTYSVFETNEFKNLVHFSPDIRVFEYKAGNNAVDDLNEILEALRGADPTEGIQLFRQTQSYYHEDVGGVVDAKRSRILKRFIELLKELETRRPDRSRTAEIDPADDALADEICETLGRMYLDDIIDDSVLKSVPRIYARQIENAAIRYGEQCEALGRERGRARKKLDANRESKSAKSRFSQLLGKTGSLLGRMT